MRKIPQHLYLLKYCSIENDSVSEKDNNIHFYHLKILENNSSKCMQKVHLRLKKTKSFNLLYKHISLKTELLKISINNRWS